MRHMRPYLINSSVRSNIHPVQFRLKSSVLSKKHHSPHWLFPPWLPFFSFLQVWTHGPCFFKLEPSAPSNLVPFCSVSPKKSLVVLNASPLLMLPFPAGKHPTSLCLSTILALNFSCPEHSMWPLSLWPGPFPTSLRQRFAGRRPSESAVSLHVIWPSLPDTSDLSPLGFQGTVLLLCLPGTFPGPSMDHSKGTDCWW